MDCGSEEKNYAYSYFLKMIHEPVCPERASGKRRWAVFLHGEYIRL